MSTRWIFALIAWVASSAPGLVFACGGLMSEIDEPPVTMDQQMSVIYAHDGVVELHARMVVSPGSEKFAWVFPIAPGAMLSLGDEELFGELGALTKPSVSIVDEREDEGGGVAIGCGSAERDGSIGSTDDEYVDGATVIDQGTLGDYEYAIIEGDTAQDVTTWLQDNGYAVPDTLVEAAGPYVEMGMQFAGIRLARPDLVDAEVDVQTPLVITSTASPDSILYPLAFSAISADKTMPVLLYVIGDQRATVANYDMTTIDDVADHMKAGQIDYEYRSYASAIDDLTTDAKDQRLFVAEYAGSLADLTGSFPAVDALTGGEGYLTRLSSRVPVGHLVDVSLDWQAADDLSNIVKRTIPADKGGCMIAALPRAAGVYWPILVVLVAVRRRRR